jgi:uridine kinase
MSTPILKSSTFDISKSSKASSAHYQPPWADVSIIGVAGSSGSGKSTLSNAIVSALNLPWVVILSMVKSKEPCE